MVSKKSKILFIGGAPAVGKSTMGKALAFQDINTYYSDGDFVRDAVLSSFPGSIPPEYSKSFFSSSTEEFLEQCKLVVPPMIVAAKKRLLRGKEDTVVVEGMHLIPGLIPTYDSEVDLGQVILTLPKSELRRRLIKRSFEEDKRPYMREDIEGKVESSCEFQKYLIAMAEQYGIQTIENISPIEKVIATSGL